ncbi:dihydroneopterin aldolase [Candidatus Woesearchaeota archaeon]|nr:dihydroneopterin aldolase [Candidatus Woesearchaeota archaeon]
MDKISLTGIKINCIIGVNADEKTVKQELLLDVDLFLSVQKAAQSDNLNDTINYAEVLSLLRKTIESKQFNLIETIAQQSAELLLKNYPVLNKVTAAVCKKPKNLLEQLDAVSAQVTR